MVLVGRLVQPLLGHPQTALETRDIGASRRREALQLRGDAVEVVDRRLDRTVGRLGGDRLRRHHVQRTGQGQQGHPTDGPGRSDHMGRSTGGVGDVAHESSGRRASGRSCSRQAPTCSRGQPRDRSLCGIPISMVEPWPIGSLGECIPMTASKTIARRARQRTDGRSPILKGLLARAAGIPEHRRSRILGQVQEFPIAGEASDAVT